MSDNFRNFLVIFIRHQFINLPFIKINIENRIDRQ